MPADDVSDLKDVFDAINKLCETMKTSNYEDAPQYVECGDGLVSPSEVEVRTVALHASRAARSPDTEDRGDAESAARSQFVSAEDLSIQRMETQRQKWRESQASLASSEVVPEERWSDTQASPPSSESAARAERWSDCRVSPPGAEDASDAEPAAAACEPAEPASELYYTASSDVSLLSDSELPERPPDADKEGGKCVMAGHVAAMRERFESMTRANTPAPPADHDAPSPDLLR